MYFLSLEIWSTLNSDTRRPGQPRCPPQSFPCVPGAGLGTVPVMGKVRPVPVLSLTVWEPSAHITMWAHIPCFLSQECVIWTVPPACGFPVGEVGVPARLWGRKWAWSWSLKAGKGEAGSSVHEETAWAKARRPAITSRGWQGWLLLETRENLFKALSWLLVTASNPWLVAVFQRLPPFTWSFPLSVCVPGLYLSSFFFFLINLFIIYFWLCWVFVAVHVLSLVAVSGGYSSCCCARASHCSGFSCCGVWALGARASVLVACGL